MDSTWLLSYGKRRVAGPKALGSLHPSVCPLRGDEPAKPLSGGYYVEFVWCVLGRRRGCEAADVKIEQDSLREGRYCNED